MKEALKAYDGALIIVSHDRDFLDGLVEKVYEFREGRVFEHLGSVAEFLARRKLETLAELDRKPVEASGEKPSAPSNAGAISYKESKEKSREDRKVRNRINYLESEIEKLEKRMKTIESVLQSPSPGDDIMELTREYLECKRDLDAKTDEWGSLSL